MPPWILVLQALRHVGAAGQADLMRRLLDGDISAREVRSDQPARAITADRWAASEDLDLGRGLIRDGFWIVCGEVDRSDRWIPIEVESAALLRWFPKPAADAAAASVETEPRWTKAEVTAWLEEESARIKVQTGKAPGRDKLWPFARKRFSELRWRDFDHLRPSADLGRTPKPEQD